MDSCVDEVRALESVQKSGAEIRIPSYEARSYTGIHRTVRAYYPMWLMEEEHPLVRSAVRAYEQQFQERAKMRTWVFSTNGVATKGVHGIPTIGFGPGDEAFAHRPNDQVRVKDLLQAMAFYAAFVQEWGG